MSQPYRGLPESGRSLSVRSAPHSLTFLFGGCIQRGDRKDLDIAREEKKQEETDEGPSQGWNEDPTSIGSIIWTRSEEEWTLLTGHRKASTNGHCVCVLRRAPQASLTCCLPVSAGVQE